MPVVQAGEDVIEFPDSMSQEDIQSALSQRYPSAPAPEAQTLPPVTLSPYDKYRLSGGEKVAGPFGPANPQEVLSLPDVLKVPAAAIGGVLDKTGIMQSLGEAGADFLHRTGINPAAQPGESFLPTRDQETYIPSPFEEAFPNVGRGAEEAVRSLATPENMMAAPFASLKPVQAAFEGQMAADVPQSFQSLVDAKTPEDITKALLLTGLNVGVGSKLIKESPKEVLPVTETPPAALTEGDLQQAPSEVTAKGGEAATSPPEPAKAEVSTPEPNSQAPTVTEPVTEPQIVGLGGAIPSEFDRAKSPTAMKYALIDEERQKRGLEPLTKPEGTTDQATLDKAMAAVDLDPSLPDKLIAELNNKPRAIEDWENHVLMLRKVDLRNEFDRSATEAAQAYEDSSQFPERLEDMQRANTRTAELSDQLDALERASRVSGSARGRALRSLQVMLNEDYSLAGLERQKRAAKGGAPLTPDERNELVRVSQELQRTQKTLADYQAGEADRQSQSAHKALLEQARTLPSKPILDVARKLVTHLDSRADAARARLRERMGRFSAGVDPTVIADLAEIGVAHIAHVGLDLGEWSDRMVGELGDWVKPHLDEVYAKSKQIVDNLSGVPAGVKKAVKGGFAALSPEEQSASTADSVRKAVSEGRQEAVGFYIQRLARSFIARGITDRGQLIDAVHGVLKDAVPDMTRREAMDAISRYGDYRPLTKDQITVKLRGLKGEMQQLAKLEDMAAGKPPLKSGMERRTATEAERLLIKEVNEAKRKFQVPVQDPETQLKSALDTLKTALENRIKDYQTRLEKGDFAKKPVRPIELDRHAQELQAQAEKVKRKFREGLIQDRLAKRHFWEKALDWTTNYRRFGVLTSVTVIPKLLSAGLQRLASLPLEDLVGSGIKRLPGVSEVAKKAPLEGGGNNIKAELAGYGAAFTQGMRDAYNTLREGHSDLDVLYGKRDYTPAGEVDLGNRLLSLPGRFHGMIKAPVKRAVFERSVQRLGEFYAGKGLDVTDPLVKTRIATEAYKAANAAIFLQDNYIASKLSQWLAPKIDKETGHPTVGSKVLSTAGRLALPITRVPINIVSEALQYSTGLVTGGTRLGFALRKGVEKLKPEEADLIMRELKKGAVGGAVLLLGYYNPNLIGGYYQQGQKRDPEDVKAGHIKVGGLDIPSWLLHNPLLETLQVGATIRRVADNIPHNDTEPEGLGYGALAGALGVLEQIPFVKETAAVQALLGRGKQKFVGEQARDMVVPQVVQQTAKAIDATDEGTLKRKTRTVGDYIKSGVPGLRQTLEPE